MITANITVTQGSAVLMLFTKAELLSWERSLMKLPQQDLQNATSYFRSQWRQPFRHYLSVRMTVPGPTPERYVVGLFHSRGADQTFEGDMEFVNPGNQHLRSLGAMADIRGSGSPARKRPRSGQDTERSNQVHQEVLDFLSDTLTTASQKVAKSHLRMKAAYEEEQEVLVVHEADLALALHALRQTGSELCRRQLEIAETRARTDEAGRALDSLQPVARLVESVKVLLEKGPEDSAADGTSGTMRMLQQVLRNLGENSLADVAPKVLDMEPRLRDGFAKTVEHHLVQEITKLEETVAEAKSRCVEASQTFQRAQAAFADATRADSHAAEEVRKRKAAYEDHHRRVSTHREALMHAEEKDACFSHLVAPFTIKASSVHDKSESDSGEGSTSAPETPHAAGRWEHEERPTPPKPVRCMDEQDLACAFKALELAAKANTYHALAQTGEVAEWKLQACSFLSDLHGLFELPLPELMRSQCHLNKTKSQPHDAILSVCNDSTWNQQTFPGLRCGCTDPLILMGGWKEEAKAKLKALDFLQGEWTNAQKAGETYVVAGATIRIDNAKGSRTFQNWLVWEERWHTFKWGKSGRYYLDKFRPHDKEVQWTFYGTNGGGKSFRWKRDESPTMRNEQSQETESVRTTGPAQNGAEVLALAPRPKPRPKRKAERPAEETAEEDSAAQAELAELEPQETEETELAAEAAEGDADVIDLEGEEATATDDVEAPTADPEAAEAEVTDTAAEDDDLLGADPGWEKERLIARKLLAQGFRPKPEEEDVTNHSTTSPYLGFEVGTDTVYTLPNACVPQGAATAKWPHTVHSMVSLGTQMKIAGAAAGASSAVGKAAGSAKQAAGGSKGASKAAESEEEDSGVEEATDSAKKDHKIKGEKKVEVGEWMDDLMEGFAELYRLAISGGQSCGDCVRKTTYPIK
ncbi:GA2OX2, partial [Symbiodinium microadriaticum]